MRYTELIEQATAKEVLTISEAWEIMQSECKNAVQAAFPPPGQQPQIAYRGTRNKHSPDIFLGASVAGRTPKNSTELFQQMVDQALMNYLGSDAAVRSNSIFVTSSLVQASLYGPKLYVIFPFDSAAITWSDTISDLVIDQEIENWTEFLPMTDLPAYQKFLQLVNQNPELREDENLNHVIAFLQNRRDYTDWAHSSDWKYIWYLWLNLPAAAHAAGKQSRLVEVLTMIDRASWYKIKINYLYFVGLAKFNQDLFIDRFSPQTGDWREALFSENEVYVRGKYVAIETDQFKKLKWWVYLEK